MRDALERQAVDSALGVVARHLHVPGVDDRRHARHRQRCFSDVRRQDDATPIDGADRRILRVAVERSVERNDLDIRRGGDRREIGARSLDLARAGQKTQDLPGGSRQHVARRFDDRLPIAVLDCERDAERRGTLTTGASPRKCATDWTSSVADITTIRRSSRASHA